tara:strand:+ start:526 stop:876 length:351 start_codon:yes stop_codon:yes gene_type:complete
MPWKYNGKEISETKGFQYTDGRTSPRNWFVVWDDTEKKNQGLVWEEPAAHTVSDEQKLSDLRRERNLKLNETDYLALSDQTLSTDMKNYRQALRDITKSYSSMDAVGFAWPTKPSS